MNEHIPGGQGILSVHVPEYVCAGVMSVFDDRAYHSGEGCQQGGGLPAQCLVDMSMLLWCVLYYKSLKGLWASQERKKEEKKI